MATARVKTQREKAKETERKLASRDVVSTYLEKDSVPYVFYAYVTLCVTLTRILKIICE